MQQSYKIAVQVRKIDNAGDLIASASAVIAFDFGDIKVKEIRVVMGKDHQPKVYLPQKDYTKGEERRFLDVLELPYLMMEEITEKILRELKPQCESSSRLATPR